MHLWGLASLKFRGQDRSLEILTGVDVSSLESEGSLGAEFLPSGDVSLFT